VLAVISILLRGSDFDIGHLFRLPRFERERFLHFAKPSSLQCKSLLRRDARATFWNLSRRLLPIYSSDDSSSQTFSIWPRYLVVIMTVTMPLTVLLNICVLIVTMIFLPLHFPLPVFELPDGYPSLRQARRRLQVRQVRIR